MRTIKFRAWRDGLMYTVFRMDFEDMDGLYVHMVNEAKNIHYHTRSLNLIKLMQFTGLHDKNGREVYEGDIVNPSRYPYDSSTMINHHEIVRYNEQGLLLPFHEMTGYEQDTWISNYVEFEVIGNIYENPELVKVKQ